MSVKRIATALSAAVLAAGAFSTLLPDRGEGAGVADPVSRGRAVYVAEGCIHCHSQYVRPVGRDVELWGEATMPERALGGAPVLIGNRRQGPDLANLGLRRNAGWNRLHLIEPAALTPGSRMPSYRHLFEPEDSRGEALLAYLDSLRPREKELARAMSKE